MRIKADLFFLAEAGDRIAPLASSTGVETATALDAEFFAYLDAGDLRQAGTWLVQRHARDVLGLCGAMVRDPTTAEDLTQDVFGKAFTALGQYRREASSRTWLLAIARNRCIDHLRAMRRDPWRGVPPDDASADPDRVPDPTPLSPELLTSRAQVEAALDELAEGERALVVLRYRHGLDYRELAHVFGIRPARQGAAARPNRSAGVTCMGDSVTENQ